MKTLFTDFEKISAIASAVEQYDEISAMSLICLLIDTVSRNSTSSAPDIARTIAEQVEAVNAELGAY